MKTRNLLLLLLVVSIWLSPLAVSGEHKHFDPKGKAPSEFTVAQWEQLKSKMPFKDRRDFEQQKKGFIAAPDYKEIMADAGHVAWSMGKYSFLLEDNVFEHELRFV